MAGLWQSQTLETGILAPHLMFFLQYHVIYYWTLNSGPHLQVLQIRAFRFDDCSKLTTQLGQAGHLTQLDLRFFIDDLGQRFQICWTHRILLLTSLFSGTHWSKSRVGPGGLEVMAQTEIKSHQPWPRLSSGLSLLLEWYQYTELHVATPGCC